MAAGGSHKQAQVALLRGVSSVRPSCSYCWRRCCSYCRCCPAASLDSAARQAFLPRCRCHDVMSNLPGMLLRGPLAAALDGRAAMA